MIVFLSFYRKKHLFMKKTFIYRKEHLWRKEHLYIQETIILELDCSKKPNRDLFF